MSEQPNILVIVTDQQRQDHLGCYGNVAIRTPCLDKLALEGVRFDRHYVNNPLCMPGRATLFTGMTPRGHTVRTNGINLPRTTPVLPGILAQAGYQTHLVGKLHLDVHHSKVPGEPTERQNYEALKAGGNVWGFTSGEMSLGHGTRVGGAYRDWLEEELDGKPNPWDQLLEGKDCGAEQCVYTKIPPALHHSTWVAERTIDFLKKRNLQKPFFVWCSFPDPHHPYVPPEAYAEMYQRDAMPWPIRREGELEDLGAHFRDAYEGTQGFSGRGANAPTRMNDDQIREIIRRTYGMVSLIDENVGRILQTLRTEALDDNTIVVFTSDHGDMMGDHWLINKGPFHFEGLLKTPFIARWPGRFPAGHVVSGLTIHLDFVPTILHITGLAFPEGNVPEPPEAGKQRAALVGRSIRPLLEGRAERIQDAVLVENDEDYIGCNLRTVVTDRYKLTCYSDGSCGELFDMHNDPGELHNLWNEDGMRDVKANLTAELLKLITVTDNPLPRRISHA